MELTLRWVREEQPGPRWVDLAGRSLPACRAWYLEDGDGARPGLDTCHARLAAHMPELVPLWERLVQLLGADPLVARLLSLYRPPPFLPGCSQAVWTRDRPYLVRNYDYHPGAFEGAFLLSRWNGTRVLASIDCLWGALDGLNEHGLTAALAFGGRSVVGDGFGIPLILRYVLELCRTTSQALDVLARVPSHMSYNVSLLDASGDHAVVYLAPDRKTRVLREAVATNHQHDLEWPLDALAARSLEREKHIAGLLARPTMGAGTFADAFLAEPIYATDHALGHGTLYTVVYRPCEGSAEFRWPRARVRQSFASFEEKESRVRYGT